MCKGAEYCASPTMCRSAAFAMQPEFGGASGSQAMGTVPGGIYAEYDLGKVVGHGMFSTVQMGTHKLTGVNVAIKVLNTMAQGRETLDAEIRAMKLTKGHPNVVNLWEVIESPDDFKTYMIMEYCEQGNLDDYLTRCVSVCVMACVRGALLRVIWRP